MHIHIQKEIRYYFYMYFRLIYKSRNPSLTNNGILNLYIYIQDLENPSLTNNGIFYQYIRDLKNPSLTNNGPCQTYVIAMPMDPSFPVDPTLF